MNQINIKHLILLVCIFSSFIGLAQTDGQVLTRTNGGSSWADSDGNGIYSGSGNIPSGGTTVTAGANALDVTTTTVDGVSIDGATLSVDGANDRVGMGTTTPTSSLHLGGSFAVSFRHFNSGVFGGPTTTDLDEDDCFLQISGQNATVNLPNASNCVGRIYIVSHLTTGRTFTFNQNINQPPGAGSQTTFSGMTMIIASSININSSGWYQLP